MQLNTTLCINRAVIYMSWIKIAIRWLIWVPRLVRYGIQREFTERFNLLLLVAKDLLIVHILHQIPSSMKTAWVFLCNHKNYIITMCKMFTHSNKDKANVPKVNGIRLCEFYCRAEGGRKERELTGLPLYMHIIVQKWRTKLLTAPREHFKQ